MSNITNVVKVMVVSRLVGSIALDSIPSWSSGHTCTDEQQGGKTGVLFSIQLNLAGTELPVNGYH